MKNPLNRINNYRVFKVKFIPPTNTRSMKIEIKETKRYSDQKDDKVILSYDGDNGDTLEQAILYLESKGFEVVGRGSENDYYYLFVDNWGVDFMNLKGEK